MTTAVFLRRLSVVCVLGYVAFTAWIALSNPGARWSLLASAITVVVGLLVFYVRQPIRWPRWSGGGDLRHIWLIVSFLALETVVSFFGGLFLGARGWTGDLATTLNFLFAISVVSAFFLVGGFLNNVRRVSEASVPVRVWIASSFLLPLGLLIAILLLSSREGSARDWMMFMLGLVLTWLAALYEEVLTRKYLLSALVEVSESRLAALILSASLFGLMHVPGRFNSAVYHQNLDVVNFLLFHYPPVLLLQAAMGIVFGAIWLRTGSLGITTAVHAMLNIFLQLGQE